MRRACPSSRARGPELSEASRMRLIALLLAVAVPGHANDAELLKAIAEVENHRWSDPGGRYAIRYAVWSDRTSLPYRLASQERFATPVAISHLNWLRQGLKRKGIAATPYVLAGCWRSGFERWTSGNAPSSHRDYARRVRNLYEEATRNPEPSAPSPLTLSAQAP
jgi:hypothetical protein